LSENDKDEQYVRKKTDKLIVLRIWVEGDVLISCI